MITFLRSAQGAVAILAAAIVASWTWVASIKSSAVQQERARVEKKSNLNAAKAKAARSAADKLPPDRLLDKRCRDC